VKSGPWLNGMNWGWSLMITIMMRTAFWTHAWLNPRLSDGWITTFHLRPVWLKDEAAYLAMQTQLMRD
jgi:hypothetical protein